MNRKKEKAFLGSASSKWSERPLNALKTCSKSPILGHSLCIYHTVSVSGGWRSNSRYSSSHMLNRPDIRDTDFATVNKHFTQKRINALLAEGKSSPKSSGSPSFSTIIRAHRVRLRSVTSSRLPSRCCSSCRAEGGLAQLRYLSVN
jgi:hypothetical protein